MKLSVWSAYYVDLSPEDALREFKSHGYDYCELSCEHAVALLERGDTKTTGAKFRQFANELGVELLQGHLSFDKRLCIDNDRAFLKKQLDLFRAIGIKNAVLHLDAFKWKNDKNISLEEKREENCKALSELLDCIKDSDLVICLENLFYSDGFVSTSDELMYFIEKFNSKNLGICLDTGHLNLVDKDQVAFIKRAGKNIKALHLDNNEGLKSDQHLMPYGLGSVDFVSVIKEMKKLDYEGLYNLEIPGERYAPLEILGYKLDYIKKMFDYLDRITE